MSDDPDNIPITSRRNILASIGTVGFGGGTAALLDLDIIRGFEPEQLSSSEIDWSADGSSEDVFPLSVMSGGPTDSGAILWTKLTDDAFVSSAPAYVQVANSDNFSEPIYEGRIDPKKNQTGKRSRDQS